MSMLARRGFIATVAAAAGSSLAGCNVLDDGGSGGIPDYADWVPASMADQSDNSVQIIGVDLGDVDDEFPADARQEIDVDQLATELDIDSSELDEFVVIQTGILTDHTVVTGSFDGDEVASRLSEEAETDSYEGFDVIQGQIAVDDGVIVFSQDYRRIVDTGTGEAERVYDQSGEWEPVFQNVGGGTMTGVFTAPEEEFDLMGIELNATGNGDGAELVAYFHFPSAEAAEENMEEAEDDVSEDDETWELVDLRLEDNVVTVEGETEDWDF